MVWYSQLLKTFPQFVVIHTVKGFDIVNKAELEVFLELSCFFDDPVDVDLILNIQKTKIMASSPITSWQIDGGNSGNRVRLYVLGSKITADGDCSHEIKRCLLLGRKVVLEIL